MPSQETRITYAGQEVLIPNPEQYSQANRKANSYNCPLGPATGVGYVLFTKKQIDDLGDDGSTARSLVFETRSDDGSSQKVTLGRLFIQKALALTPGADLDPDAAYLLTLVDVRFHLNKWSSTQRQFNVRSAAGEESYLAETVNASGVPFTWDQMIGLLWGDCAMAGNYQGLPTTPTAPPPENLHFVGVNAWHALHSVLEKIGMTSRYNPLTQIFDIVEVQSAEHDPPEFKDLIFKAFPFSGGACVAPGIIRVMFKVIFEDYGQERDTETTNNYVTSQSTFSYDIQNADFAEAGSVLPLWDDLPAIKGHGTNTIINQTELAEKAQQRAIAWFQANSANQNSRVQGIGQGALKIAPSGVIKQVLWSDFGPEGGGMLTSAAKYPGVFKESPEDAASIGSSGGVFGGVGPVDESSLAPDFARHTYPTYPRLPNFVVFSEGTPTSSTSDDCCPSEGDMLEAYEGKDIFGGAVIRYDSVSGQMIILEACWIKALGERKCNVGPIVRKGDVSHGRLSGMYTATSGENEGLKLPLYVVRVDDYLSVEVKCNCGTDVAYASRIFRKCKVDNLTFDLGVGFVMDQPSNNVDGACLSIQSPCQFSILNQWSTGQRPVWTQDPKFHGNITVGGVVKFSGTRDIVGGSLTVRSGENISLGGIGGQGGGTGSGVNCGQPIEVVGVTGNCVRWAYGPRGLDGSISVYHCGIDGSYECAFLTFENGRIVEWGGSPVSGNLVLHDPECPPAACPRPDLPPCNPCDTVSPSDRGPTGDELINPPVYTPEGETSEVPSFPDPGPFPPVVEESQTGPQDNPPASIPGVTNTLSVNRDLFVPRCTETFACGEDTDKDTCRRLITIMERGWEDFLPLNENQTAILEEFAPIMGPNDYERLRDTLSRCVAAELADLEIIAGIGSSQPDPCTGLTFANATPSNSNSFAAAFGAISNSFLNFRPFTEAIYNDLLATFDTGGGSALELGEFQQFRTIAACYFDVDRRAAEEKEG